MKKTLLLITALAFLVSLVSVGNASAEVFKWIRINNMQARIKDNGHQSETQTTGYYRYYTGANNPGFTWANSGPLRCGGTRFAVKDWTDQNGKKWNYMIADCPYGTSDEFQSRFSRGIGGVALKRYWRYPQPDIYVDGHILHEPVLEGDELAPSKVWGTADVMTESLIGSRIGLDIEARTLAWTQSRHDDYSILDWTIKNTGNVDKDAEVELPNQTLTGLYIMRQYEIFPNQGASYEWSSWWGCRPGEDVRITYSYPPRINGSDFDNFGDTQKGTGFIRGPVWAGETVTYLSAVGAADDPAQPQMHCVGGPDDYEFKVDAFLQRPESDWELAYHVMEIGYKAHVAKGQNPDYMTGTYPGTHHDLEPDQRGFAYPNQLGAWWFWHHVTSWAAGPYTLKPGESIRLVRAFVAGSITPQQQWTIGKAWKAGTAKATWVGSMDDLKDYYPAYKSNPTIVPSDNDKAKDRWVASGKDSMLNNARAANFGWKMNYQVPIPPPPPSVNVKSQADYILVTWNNESEKAADFAGYRVYRAVGGYVYNEVSGVPVGNFSKVFECTKANVVHEFQDKTAERGQSYFYYVTAYDDGKSNAADWDGVVRPLESGCWSNRTTFGARLQRGATTSLDSVRVVPNPFNIDARAFNWKGENDRLMFMGLPPVCKIKVYSESGDLIKVLNHTNGYGDESWGTLSQEWQTTTTGQMLVSGLYIARIETPDGQAKNIKFLVVR